MKYLLDTNVCIKYLNGSSQNVAHTFSTLSPDDILLCSIVKAELLTGAHKSNSFEKTIQKLDIFFGVFESIPFDDKASKIYAKIRAVLEKSGNIIGPYDLQIASIALQYDLTLVTHNSKEFSRIKELKITDWE